MKQKSGAEYKQELDAAHEKSMAMQRSNTPVPMMSESSKADKKMDKKMGYKEGSKKDTALDKKKVKKVK